MKIGIAEDHKHLMDSICKNLAEFEDVELIFKATNGLEVIQKCGEQQPDVILMDINMPLMNGIETTKKIKHIYPEIKIIMLTVFQDTDHIFDAIMAGASGYLLKDIKPAKLIAALEDVMDGGAPMSPAIASRTLTLLRGKNEPIVYKESTDDMNLSAREIEILESLSNGLNYNQIAENSFISPKTVRKHIENIYKKLHAHNKVEAINIAKKKAII